jgi:hypothetical protein
MSAALSIAAATGAAPAQTAGWWWDAGDSRDDAAVFVDGGSLSRSGDRASARAVRIARDGTASMASWTGRCGDRDADDAIAAVARFACGTEADHMQQAAILPGLSPAEAARAIFGAHAPGADRHLSAARRIS